ncbi:MAG: hypothetical protein NC203_09545 [Firmicutes bacterium]|nr:hypothetical protein [[Eubacterium] siraeum]MCM1488598.1 hypothetical protein [Bacillota bacterium]
MKKSKQVLLFLLSVLIISVMILLSCEGWGILLFIQRPGGLFNKGDLPLAAKLADLFLILPVNIGIIFLTAYGLSRIGKGKAKNGEAAPQGKPAAKKFSGKNLIAPSVSVAAAMVLIFTIRFIDYNKPEIKAAVKNVSVTVLVNNADEIITYDNSGNIYSPFFNTDIRKSSALIDYDKMTVTFMYKMSGDRYKTVQLAENGFIPRTKHTLQFKNPLNEGGEIRVYYDNTDKTFNDGFKSCAVSLDYNGKSYGAEFEPEPMDFDSCLDDLYRLDDSSLERIVYHDNEMFPYTGNISSDTLFIDYENKKLYLIYTHDSGLNNKSVYISEKNLEEVTEVKDVYLQAEYDLENGGKLYAYGSEDYTLKAADPVLKWETQKTDGLVLKYGDKLYCAKINTTSDYFDFLHSTGAKKSHTPQSIA